MVTKSLKLDDRIVENLELVAKGLNEKAGTDVYDFSNIVRVALNQYLNNENIKEIIESIKQKEISNRKDLLLASESSLNKDWLRPEEDKAWANLFMKVGIGQDSHRFDFENKDKKLILGGVVFDNCLPLDGNSDADVVLHAITNAVSGVTCVNILGKVSDEMCLVHGIKDSSAYLREALQYLGENKIVHVSISMECLVPNITPKIPEMRTSLSKLLNIPENYVGITATTGEGLTEFGCGNGIQVFCCVTVT